MKKKIKKIEQFIIKHDKLFFIIVFFIMIIGKTLYMETLPEDEMWNFQNIYKMYNGYKIYIDANVITTPLFHFIGLILFKLFGANFFVFKLYNAFLCLFIFFGIYKLFKTLKITKIYSFSFTFIMFLLSGDKLIGATANYNSLAILFVIYAILLNINKAKYKNYFLYEAILMFLIIITKQNVGIYYIIGYIIYSIIEPKQLKQLVKISGLLIVFSAVFLYILFKLNVLQGFINYCFFGIKEFGQYNITVDVYWTLVLIFIGLINGLLIVFMKYNINCKMNNNEKNNVKIIACFAYMIGLISYPMFNKAHINYSLILQYILLIYMLYINFKNIKINKKYVIYVISLLIIILSVESIIFVYEYFNIVVNDKYKNVYFGTLFDDNIKAKIETVTKWIEKSDKNVIILSPDAVLYMIPLKQSNSEMDLILLGNLGRNGENNIIEKVSKLDNKIILINKEKLSYQESDRLREYVVNNFINIGEIEDLLIFETK